MLLVIVALAVVGLVIWRLTSGPGKPSAAPIGVPDAEVLDRVLPVAARGAASPLYRARSEALGGVLREMLSRMGVDGATAQSVLGTAGFAVPPDESPEDAPALGVLSVRRAMTASALERALLVGIALARRDDDYAKVSDEAIDLEALAREADATEQELFGEGRREQHAFYARACLVLQDMAQLEADEARRRTLGAVLGAFDDAAHALQDEMARAMAHLPRDESALLWGDSADRRLYYYKMGVTNSLRRSGVLDSLRHLYRYQGVNYDVEEAYDLASRECPPLVRAEDIGLERLLTMGPRDVQAMVQGALPR